MFYVLLFGSMGAYLPFWPLWLEDWGLSKAEVGYFLSVAIVVRIAAGLGLPILADRLDSRRNMVALLCCLGAVLFLSHLWIDSKLILLLATAATGGVIAGVMPLGEALGMAASRRHSFGYAPARAMGSLAFLIVAYLVGVLVVDFGINVVLYIIVACYFAAIFLGKTHPGGGFKGQARPGLRDLARMIGHPTFALFAIGMGCLQSSHAVYFAYASVHWRALGLSEDQIGLLWSFAIFAEVAIMLGPGPALLRWTGIVGAIGISCVISALRWAAMTADPTGLWLWLLQGTHAFTFGLGHLGAMAFIAAAIPERANASAQGAYSGLAVGVFMTAGTVLSAQLFPTYEGLTYLVGTAIALMGALSCLLLAKRWHGTALSV